MAASSWATLEAARALLQEHGGGVECASVPLVKEAAAKDASVVAPLTVGLDKWASMAERIKEAAKDVDIIIPARELAACCEAALLLLVYSGRLLLETPAAGRGPCPR